MFYTQKGHDLILRVLVVPNAKQDEVIGPFEDAIKIKIKVPPVENKANHHLCHILSRWFEVPKTSVSILKGHTSRKKLVLIKNPKVLPKWCRVL